MKNRTDEITPRVPVSPEQVTIRDDFWQPRQQTNHNVTIRRLLDNLKETGRIGNFARAAGRERGGFVGMLYNDSDVYKVLEAASHSLLLFPDEELKEELDGIIDLIEAAQQEDGYLNTYFTLSEPDKRWTNLNFMHELFCAGHLVEAALVYKRATGDERLLNVAIRFVDYIYEVFGPDGRSGYPGHQELELALVSLYRETGVSRYLELARLFLERRGREPSLFAREFARLDQIAGKRVQGYPDFAAHVRALFLDEFGNYDGSYAQDHLPLRKQREVVGHAVRAVYQYCGMADVALETGDEAMRDQLKALWEDMTRRKMYVTGGIGSSHGNEGFTDPYDLPNRTAYSETCASVGSFLWNFRMFRLTGEGKYYDLAERVLYNAFLAGVSHDGERFFYINPLESEGDHHREPWFECACCPPNAARLIGSLGGYIYASDRDGCYVNLYIAGHAGVDLNGVPARITQRHHYPREGEIEIEVEPESPVTGKLMLRLPSWAGEYRLSLNGEPVDRRVERGYLIVERQWEGRASLSLDLPMAPRVLRADPRVAENRAKVAYARGPLVYCFEEVDNGTAMDVASASLTAGIEEEHSAELPESAVALKIEGWRDRDGSSDDVLYYEPSLPRQAVELTAIPYFLWDNRRAGKMKVWIPGC